MAEFQYNKYYAHIIEGRERKKEQRDITCSTYERARKRMDKDVNNWLLGKNK